MKSLWQSRKQLVGYEWQRLAGAYSRNEHN